MTAPDHMPEAFKGTCMKRGIHTWSLRQTRGGSVLLHGAGPRGAELIAAKWAESRKVVQICFKPDWARHAKAAPFKRNDLLLETMPAGVIVFPGSGITDKARRIGIPVWRLVEGRT